MITASLLSVTMLCFGGAAQEFENATELEAAILAARRVIRNGSFDVTCVTTSPKGKRFEIGVRCAFDFAEDDRLRLEWPQVIPGITAGGKQVTVVSNEGKSLERLIVSGKRLLQGSPDQFSDGSTLSATISSHAAPRNSRILDPRVFGISAESFGHIAQCRLRRIFPSSDQERILVPVTKEMIDGKPVLKVELADDRRRIVVCVSPEENHSIVYFEMAGTYDGKTMVSSNACKNTFYEPGNVWFPEDIHFSRRLDGELIFEEQVSIRDAKFNVGDDPELFTVSRLGLRKGTSVVDLSRPGVEQEWDGAKLVSVGGFSREEQSTDIDSIVDRRAFGQLYNAIAARKQLDALLEQKVRAVDLICGLTGDQREEFRAAGRGDIKRLLERLEEVDARFQLAENSADEGNELLAEARHLEKSFTRPGLPADPLLFAKVPKTTLTAEQLVKFEPLRVVFGRGGLVTTVQRGSEDVLRIDLTGTALADDDLAHLSMLSSLESLVLSKTQVTDAGLLHLSRLKGLSNLTLSDTHVSDTGVADLQRSLPQLKITVDK